LQGGEKALGHGAIRRRAASTHAADRARGAEVPPEPQTRDMAQPERCATAGNGGAVGHWWQLHTAATEVAGDQRLAMLASLRDSAKLSIVDIGHITQHPLIERFVREGGRSLDGFFSLD